MTRVSDMIKALKTEQVKTFVTQLGHRANGGDPTRRVRERV